MVTVAKKFDVPIKLLFPYGDGKFSMLGLGDMVIPGLVVSLALKFDVDCYLQKLNTTKDGKSKSKLSIETPIFNAMLFSYGMGIIITLLGMNWSGKP